MRYVALLRGINVGGNNPVKMSELRPCCEQLGFEQVSTYIQSGNVLFQTRRTNLAALSATIENAVAQKFCCAPIVVVVAEEQLGRVLHKPPADFGSRPAEYLYDIAFVRSPLRADEILPEVQLKKGVDDGWEGNGVLYFRRLKARASQSYLSKLVQLRAYKSMTIRNWNTTSKLYQLMTGGAAS